MESLWKQISKKNPPLKPLILISILSVTLLSCSIWASISSSKPKRGGRHGNNRNGHGNGGSGGGRKKGKRMLKSARVAVKRKTRAPWGGGLLKGFMSHFTPSRSYR